MTGFTENIDTEKFAFAQLVRNFKMLYGTLKSISVFTRASY
jgi:hypothetical protein